MTLLFQKIAFWLFALVAVAYLVQLARLFSLVKRDDVLWLHLGKPSLFTWSGQRSFDRVIFSPSKSGVLDPAILQTAQRTRRLLIAALICFAVAVVAFFGARR
jgi:hypothetical protein